MDYKINSQELLNIGDDNASLSLSNLIDLVIINTYEYIRGVIKNKRYFQISCSIFAFFFLLHWYTRLLYVLGPPSNIFFQLVLISWIWQIISFLLPPNEYGCVYAWTTLESGPAIDLHKMPILAKKNHLFRWSSLWFWCFEAQNTLKNRRTQNESLFGADFGPEA